MRHSPLDSSVPRGAGPGRGEGRPLAEPAAPIHYLPPILATGGSALVLALVFGLVGFIAVQVTLGLLNPPPGMESGPLLATAGCGLLALLLLGATLYFVYAVITAARDLGAAPETLSGRVRMKHTGRGRGGGHWIIVGPEHPAGDPVPGGSPLPQPGSLAAPGARPEEDARGRSDVENARPRIEPARSSGQGFGSHLQEAQVTVRGEAADPAVPIEVALAQQTRRLAPDEVSLRVDKLVYEALATGDRVEVVYSPHLQHVYQVRRHAEGTTVVLRNRALI